MKKIILFLLILISQNLYSQGLREIEDEFNLIYKEYCKKIHHKIQYSECLDTIAMIHVNYLVNQERNIITHHQLDVPKYRTLGNRIFSVYDVHRGEYGEIVIIGGSSGTETAKERAQRFFDGFMKSTGHRKIMINKTFN